MLDRLLEQLSEVPARLALLAGGLLILAVAAYISVSKPKVPQADARTRFMQAAATLGITDEKRKMLRDDLQRDLIYMESDKCDETRRALAGLSAVAYYVTLLEKPVIAAKLHMTRRGICEVATEKPEEPLSIARNFSGGLRLSWECMPGEWRTPLDLALQAKIEQGIALGVLTSEAMSGTLGVAAVSWKDSQFHARCSPAQRYEPSSSFRNLPVLSAPRDSWGRL